MKVKIDMTPLKKPSVRDVHETLEKLGLRTTRPRAVVAQVFFESEGHLRIDEIWQRARARDPKVAMATVYRTMKLLTESGLARERDFGDGHARYELADEAEHSHLICNACGKITEFENERIGVLQESVAKKHGFRVRSQKLELYGTCAACQRAQA